MTVSAQTTLSMIVVTFSTSTENRPRRGFPMLGSASSDMRTKCDVACGMVKLRQQWYWEGLALSQSSSA